MIAEELAQKMSRWLTKDTGRYIALIVCDLWLRPLNGIYGIAQDAL